MLLTSTGAQVAKIFIGDPGQERWGSEITTMTNIKAGTVYPMLETMKADGLIVDRWETDEEMIARKPGGSRRRYWRLTSKGRTELVDYVARWDARMGGVRIAR